MAIESAFCHSPSAQIGHRCRKPSQGIRLARNLVAEVAPIAIYFPAAQRMLEDTVRNPEFRQSC